MAMSKFMKQDVRPIVTMASRTVSEKISWEMWPRRSPCATIMRENSDICASETEAKKDVLFLYPKKEQINITTRGFIIMVIAKNIINGFNMDSKVLSISSMPSETKNNTEKKSRRELILPIISRL